MDQCSRRVLWSAGSLPCCARAALAYTRMLSKPSRAPRRRNFEWRVFTPPKKIRLSSDCSGRRRKVGLGRAERGPGSPKADVEPASSPGRLPKLGLSQVARQPRSAARSRATPSARQQAAPGHLPRRSGTQVSSCASSAARTMVGPPRGTNAPDYGSVGAATPTDEELLPLPAKLRRRTTRAAAAAAACLAVAGTVAIARQTRPTKNDASPPKASWPPPKTDGINV